ncbi:MAG: hypothetical protein WDW36_005556 [Sanguina aurantia]
MGHATKGHSDSGSSSSNSSSSSALFPVRIEGAYSSHAPPPPSSTPLWVITPSTLPLSEMHHRATAAADNNGAAGSSSSRSDQDPRDEATAGGRGSTSRQEPTHPGATRTRLGPHSRQHRSQHIKELKLQRACREALQGQGSGPAVTADAQLQAAALEARTGLRKLQRRRKRQEDRRKRGIAPYEPSGPGPVSASRSAAGAQLAAPMHQQGPSTATAGAAGATSQASAPVVNVHPPFPARKHGSSDSTRGDPDSTLLSSVGDGGFQAASPRSSPEPVPSSSEFPELRWRTASPVPSSLHSKTARSAATGALREKGQDSTHTQPPAKPPASRTPVVCTQMLAVLRSVVRTTHCKTGIWWWNNDWHPFPASMFAAKTLEAPAKALLDLTGLTLELPGAAGSEAKQPATQLRAPPTRMPTLFPSPPVPNHPFVVPPPDSRWLELSTELTKEVGSHAESFPSSQPASSLAVAATTPATTDPHTDPPPPPPTPAPHVISSLRPLPAVSMWNPGSSPAPQPSAHRPTLQDSEQRRSSVQASTIGVSSKIPALQDLLHDSCDSDDAAPAAPPERLPQDIDQGSLSFSPSSLCPPTASDPRGAILQSLELAAEALTTHQHKNRMDPLQWTAPKRAAAVALAAAEAAPRRSAPSADALAAARSAEFSARLALTQLAASAAVAAAHRDLPRLAVGSSVRRQLAHEVVHGVNRHGGVLLLFEDVEDAAQIREVLAMCNELEAGGERLFVAKVRSYPLESDASMFELLPSFLGVCCHVHSIPKSHFLQFMASAALPLLSPPSTSHAPDTPHASNAHTSYGNGNSRLLSQGHSAGPSSRGPGFNKGLSSKADDGFIGSSSSSSSGGSGGSSRRSGDSSGNIVRGHSGGHRGTLGIGDGAVEAFLTSQGLLAAGEAALMVANSTPVPNIAEAITEVLALRSTCLVTFCTRPAMRTSLRAVAVVTDTLSALQGVEVLVRFQTLDWGQGKFVMQLTAVRLLLADSVSNGKMRLRIQA